MEEEIQFFSPGKDVNASSLTFDGKIPKQKTFYSNYYINYFRQRNLLYGFSRYYFQNYIFDEYDVCYILKRRCNYGDFIAIMDAIVDCNFDYKWKLNFLLVFLEYDVTNFEYCAEILGIEWDERCMKIINKILAQHYSPYRLEFLEMILRKCPNFGEFHAHIILSMMAICPEYIHYFVGKIHNGTKTPFVSDATLLDMIKISRLNDDVQLNVRKILGIDLNPTMCKYTCTQKKLYHFSRKLIQSIG